MKLRKQPRPAPFQVSWGRAYEDLQHTMGQFAHVEWGVECPLGLTGRDLNRNYANDPQRTVTLRYHDDGSDVVISVDRYPIPAHNLRAIGLAMEARRMNMVRGIDDAVQATYLALPAPELKRDPYEVLGVRPDAPLDFIEDVYRLRAKKAHPDVAGGSEADMAALNEAIEWIRAQAPAVAR